GHGLEYRVSMLVARLFFRGIYFPQMNRRAWARLVFDNRRTISALAKEGFVKWRAARKKVHAAATEARAS
ncbi:MAG TPA: hypothetical protein VF588_06905, partial [Pyrinomonadaceae bacterium]